VRLHLRMFMSILRLSSGQALRRVLFGAGMIAIASSARADGVPTDCSQLIVAVAPDWNSMRGKLQLFERTHGGDWSPITSALPVLFGKNGLAWGIGLSGQNEPGLRKKERDGRRQPEFSQSAKSSVTMLNYRQAAIIPTIRSRKGMYGATIHARRIIIATS